ncbi:hypothetical protein Halxa_0795 [Halopiger xanaduensis SH-6]|uniref:Uncharacterized protein n=1 Tax=Halopiger xanaduensis (strain DSM 18323 / JCM 14033 / SH-6) TaxID=797210 RepID=F8D705_HALXS|nr:hypothetical protein Halxa_0795 [Halopiger xanaduensis SH-6]
MPSNGPRTELPTSVGILVTVVLSVSLAYALLTANILLWVFGVVSIGVSGGVLYLFYRLVTAVEEIAHKL